MMSEEKDKGKSVQPEPPTEPPSVPAPTPPPTPASPPNAGKLDVSLGGVTSGATQGDATEKDEPSIAPPPETPKPPTLIGLRPVLPETPGVRSFMAGALKNAWRCPNGHILGIVLTEQRNGVRITRLGLLPFAFEPHELIPENILVSKIDAGEIACTRCGMVRVWHPSEWLTGNLIAKLRRS